MARVRDARWTARLPHWYLCDMEIGVGELREGFCSVKLFGKLKLREAGGKGLCFASLEWTPKLMRSQIFLNI